MSIVVHDVDRPDVGGVPPRMKAICEAAKKELSAGFLDITTDDNLCSSVVVRGSLDPRSEWPNNVWNNSRYFMFFLRPENQDKKDKSDKRLYDEGDRVSVKLHISARSVKSFRKYTSTPDNVLAKIKEWIESH